jgi:hypothetical protein
LTKVPRAAYWDTKPIQQNWSRYDKPWTLLQALALKAQRGEAVEVRDVYGFDAVTDSALSTNISRLKKMLPPDLRRHIQGTGQRSYCLKLDRGKIHILKGE